MCILCKNKKDKIPLVDTDTITQSNIDRKGLSNIYNIQQNFGVCNEVFKNPLYYVDGAAKPTTGFTTTSCSGITTATTYTTSACTAVYNLSEIDDFSLTFNITGNTQYTGYTGNFCYHTFDLNNISRETNLISSRESVLTNCKPFSTITGNTFTETINVGVLPLEDKQYILKDYAIFNTKNCPTKLRINSFNLSSQTVDSLFEDGWYFVTVTNPDKPILSTNTQNDLLLSSTLVTEIPLLQEGQSTVFGINGTPLNNEMIVYVNGIMLTRGEDWDTIPGYVGLFELKTASLEPDKDIIMVTYLNLSRDTEDSLNLYETYLNTDAFIVSNITSGITSGVTSPVVNYNPVKNRQEILLTKPLGSQSSPIFVVNGVTLGENIDYYKSGSDNRRLIMDPNSPIKLGDSISVFYLTNEAAIIDDLGYFRTLTPTINWSVPSTYNKYLSDDGLFLLQITTEDDIEFLNPIQQKYTEFNQFQLQYSQVLDELPTNVGQKFFFRVYFFKNYDILFNNTITTRNVSDIATFRVNIGYGKNSY
jgi:hypothetical protein